jgi:hypothetical protein
MERGKQLPSRKIAADAEKDERIPVALAPCRVHGAAPPLDGPARRFVIV